MAGILKCDRVQSDSNLAFQIGSSNVAYFNTTGLNVTGGEIIAGGSTLRTTGGLIYANNGIAFPATQVPSADANTLDDYEEGTWTPAIGLLGTISYSNQSGRYVKIGKVVWIEFYITYSSTDTTQDANTLFINGLPFTSSSSGALGTSCMLTERVYGINSPTVPNTFHISAVGNSTSLLTYQNNYNGGITNASYFVSNVRSCYKGGTQYMYGQLNYHAAN
jgi:hypothetical protein